VAYGGDAVSKHAKTPALKPSPRRWLLVRFGGQGDALFLTPVAAELSRRGWQVHIATNEAGYPLVQHLPFVAKTYKLLRDQMIAPSPGMPDGRPADLIEWRGAWQPVEAVYPHYPGPGPEYGPHAVTNYYGHIEGNSLHPWICATQNSDYVNVYDLAFSWAHIDPTTVPAEFRRPRYVVTAQEQAAVRKVIANLPRPLYLVQCGASSPARSYYRTAELYNAMTKATKGSVVVWNGQNWESRGKAFPLPPVPDSTPMRMSAALVAEAQLVISADTAISHIAEAVGTRHLTFYSTVPAWTRSRDYIHEITIDLQVPDSRGRDACKCQIIGRDCPRIAREAVDGLDDRSRELLRLLPPQQQAAMGLIPEMLNTGGLPPHEHFETTPQGLQAEHNAAVQAYEGARQRLAYCVASLDLWPHVEKAMKEAEPK